MWMKGYETRYHSTIKWVTFAAALWLMAFAGTFHTFPTYAPVLKAVMNYDQTELQLLGGALNSGRGFGLVAGVLSSRAPFWIVLSIGSFMSVTGYGFLWLTVTELISPPPYTMMYWILYMVGNSSTWMTTVAVVVTIQNFPFHRGSILGLLKGILGLATCIYVQLCSNLFDNNVELFLLLLAFLPVLGCIIAVVFLRRVTPVPSQAQEAADWKMLIWINAFLITFALLALGFAIVQYLNPGGVSPTMSRSYLFLLLGFALSPILIPFKSFLSETATAMNSSFDTQFIDPLLPKETENIEREDDSVSKGDSVGAEVDTPVSSALEAQEAAVNEDPGTTEQPAAKETPLRKQIGKDQFLVPDAMKTPEMWLIFWAFFCGNGMMLTFAYNLGQITEAFGYDDTTIFLTVFGVFTFFGNVGFSSLSDYLVRSAAIPRAVITAVIGCIMCVCYLVLAFDAFPGALYAVSGFAGLCGGAHLAIFVATISELFGLRFIGDLYNFLLMTSTLAGNLFSGILVGKLYDREAHRHDLGTILSTGMKILEKWGEIHPFAIAESALTGGKRPRDDSESCVGAHCFKITFILMAGVSVLGVVLNVALIRRVKSLYRKWYGSTSTIPGASQAENIPTSNLPYLTF